MQTNPATGLPVLPKDHFWRVKERYGKFHYVTIRRNVTLLGMVLFSYEVAEEMILRLDEQEIQREAKSLFRKVFEKRQLLGDYVND